MTPEHYGNKTVMIEVKGLTKYFGGLGAVRDVSLSVQPGQIVGLIGPNGAGKTTLFNLINGYYKPTSGEISLRGEKITGLKPHKICMKGIARTFQVVKPLARMTVVENVMVGAFFRSNSIAEAKARAEDIISFMGLGDERNKLARDLTLAKQKRLEMARAMATQPELLLLDEAVAGLNPKEITDIIATIKKINERGITIIAVEHVMKFIMKISDKIIVLNYGEKIAEGSPREIVNNEDVIQAYLGKKYA